MSTAVPRPHGIRIGIDLDNTIIDYGDIVLTLARERGLVPASWAGGKQSVRSELRGRDSGEADWQRLQAAMYGPRILDARLYDGARAFLARCAAAQIPLTIISHKTARAAADPDGCDLHDAARAWLRYHGVVGDGGVSENDVHFAASRAEKIACIAAAQCTIFIDDLVEVLLDPEFPSGVTRWYLGGAESDVPCGAPLLYHASWSDLLASLEREIKTA